MCLDSESGNEVVCGNTWAFSSKTRIDLRFVSKAVRDGSAALREV